MEWYQNLTECWLMGRAFQPQWPLLSRLLCSAPVMLFPILKAWVVLVPGHSVESKIFGIGQQEGQKYHLRHNSTSSARPSA